MIGGGAGLAGILAALAAATAAVACGWAARRAGRNGGTPWLLLCGCGLVWFGASGTRLAMGSWSLGGRVGFALVVSAALLALLGLLRLPGATPHSSGQARTLIDGLIVGSSALFVAWALGLDDLYRRASSPLASAAVGQTVAQLVVASAALVILTRARPTARPRLALLAAGFGALTLADGARVAVILSHSSGAGRLPLFGWAAGWMLVAWAAVRFAPTKDGEGLTPGLPTRASVLIPSTPFAIALMVAAVSAARGRFGSFLVWDGVAVMVLIVARQVFALLENISFWRDLEAKVEARTAALERSEARFRSLVQHSSDVITVLAADGTVRYESPSMRAVFGHQAASFGPGPPLGLVHPGDAPRVAAAVTELRRRPGASASIEGRVRHRDGSWRHVEAIVTNLLDDENVAGYVVNTRDITERKVLEEQLAHRAFHDPLTDLANRALFSNRLQHTLSRSIRTGNAIAVLFLDLDDFKYVNDSLGHGSGDDLLIAVARRLEQCTRPADTVARLGGDEFAILVEELDEALDVAHVAERILDALAPPVTVGGREVFVRGSVGIAINQQSAAITADELLRNADVAMYAAKARGKGGYELFESSMHTAFMERVELENDLRSALERGEFELDYQPIVALEGWRIVGVEALIRWRHPAEGRLAPGRFIHLAEESGLIIPITRWVLERACRQAREWDDTFPQASAMTLAVNLSASQLEDPGLIEDVARALEGSGLEPHRLVLEVTEGILVEESETTITRLQELRDLGARVAIDDFGTGYSSLGYLRTLPVDLLKLDRAFMADLKRGSSQAALVGAVVAMARSLQLTPVAEGVEHPDQATELRRMGCELAQGYHLAYPASPAAIAPLLEAGKLSPRPGRPEIPSGAIVPAG
jgi:diguanylate cyclase (GGDEF)-like protein/PAS domain S-box-containing protein